MRKNIERLLFESKLSGNKIANESGVPQSTVSRFLTGESKLDNMKLITAEMLNDYYLNNKEEIKMNNIKEVLQGWFQFKKYSSYKNEVEEFENTLQEFAELNVYESFTHLLEENEHLREDAEGDLIPLHDIMPNSMEGERMFSDFLEDNMNISDWNRITLDDATEPVILGEAIADHEVSRHLIKLSDIEKESDLLEFINDVLADLGEVTHATGTKNEYEVVGVE